MTLRRVPRPTGEPFWDALLRRHPDLELVLLPPEEPRDPGAAGAAPPPPLDDATVEAVRGALRAAIDTVLARVRVDPVPSGEQLLDRLTAGAARGSVVAHVRRVVPGGADEATPDEVEEALRADGWSVRTFPGIVHRVVGTRQDLPAGARGVTVGVTLEVGLLRATGSLQIEVESADLYVGPDRARALLRAERERPAAGTPDQQDDRDSTDQRDSDQHDSDQHDGERDD